MGIDFGIIGRSILDAYLMKFQEQMMLRQRQASWEDYVRRAQFARQQELQDPEYQAQVRARQQGQALQQVDAARSLAALTGQGQTVQPDTLQSAFPGLALPKFQGPFGDVPGTNVPAFQGGVKPLRIAPPTAPTERVAFHDKRSGEIQIVELPPGTRVVDATVPNAPNRQMIIYPNGQREILPPGIEARFPPTREGGGSAVGPIPAGGGRYRVLRPRTKGGKSSIFDAQTGAVLSWEDAQSIARREGNQELAKVMGISLGPSTFEQGVSSWQASLDKALADHNVAVARGQADTSKQAETAATGERVRQIVASQVREAPPTAYVAVIFAEWIRGGSRPVSSEQWTAWDLSPQEAAWLSRQGVRGGRGR